MLSKNWCQGQGGLGLLSILFRSESLAGRMKMSFVYIVQASTHNFPFGRAHRFFAPLKIADILAIIAKTPIVGIQRRSHGRRPE